MYYIIRHHKNTNIIQLIQVTIGRYTRAGEPVETTEMVIKTVSEHEANELFETGYADSYQHRP